MNPYKAIATISLATLVIVGFVRLAYSSGVSIDETHSMTTISHANPATGGNGDGTETFNTTPKKVACPSNTKAITVTPPTGGIVKCAFSDITASTTIDPTVCGSGCDQTQFNAAISEVYGYCESSVICKINCGI